MTDDMPVVAAARRVTGVFVYPFKSAAGVAVDEVAVDAVGLRDDRRWMVVDAEGSFVSQRTHPRMALLKTRISDKVVQVEAPDIGVLDLRRAPPDPSGHGSYRVWFSDRYAVDCGAEAAAWASEYLQMPCRVVQAVWPPGMPPLNDEGRVRAGFADASPALVVSLASLAALNARLETPLPMDRFRPNLVVDGFGAFEEDEWGTRHVGDVPTRGGRPCPRCATTQVDQATGAKGDEPLRTLATFRRNARGEVDFGVNIRFEAEGHVRVGDPVS